MIDAGTFDAPQLPWRQEPKRPRACARDVIRRWQFGHDTAAIAGMLGIPEPDVCRIVAADQDRRHKQKLGAALNG